MQLETLDYVVIVVEDLGASLDFYVGKLGLALRHRAARYAQLESGTTRLGLYTRDALSETIGRPLAKTPADASGFELGFKVNDCDAAFAELVAAGVEPVTPPTTRVWGQRTAYLTDPDGHLIELAEDL